MNRSDHANHRIRALVVDDVKVERMMLKHLIEAAPSLEWVGEAEGVNEALKLIRERRPEVIFLDVEMPGASGFELLKQLDEVPRVVFVCSSARYAVDAFSCEAADYLLKPVTPERFEATVRRLEPQTGRGRESEAGASLCVKTHHGMRVVSLADLSAVKADGDFCWAYQRDQAPLFLCKRLGEMEDELPRPPFIRVDRSLVVNVKAIVKLERKTRLVSKLLLAGVSEPLEIGRTATARLLVEMRGES